MCSLPDARPLFVAIWSDGRVMVNRMRRGDPAIFDLCARAKEDLGIALQPYTQHAPDEISRTNFGADPPVQAQARDAGAEYQALFRQIMTRDDAAKASEIDIQHTDRVAQLRFRSNTHPTTTPPEQYAPAAGAPQPVTSQYTAH